MSIADLLADPEAAVAAAADPAAAAAPELLDLPQDLEGKVARAQGALTAMLRRGLPAVVAWSAGKDSSTVLNLLLDAAAKMNEAGEAVPPIVVTHADTMVENPEMVLYAQAEMLSVQEFAKRHGLDLVISTSRPNLTDQWPVRVIGGRALPPFPGTNRDCTKDWKISPMAKLRKKVMRSLQAQLGDDSGLEPVVLIGTRYEESVERAKNMRERGESDVQIRRGVDEKGKPSSLFLSPIAFWTADDVWEYLGTVRAGQMRGYSNFEETFRVYADAMGTSCAVVAEDMAKTLKASKACGARHGCSICTLVGNDQSMENMIAQPRYEYMRGLNRLRNFVANTRWDMERRSWLGRSIKEGYVRIAPDAYSPRMMEELLQYALTIDARELRAAAKEDLPGPRFRLVNLEQLFAIDVMWSLQGFHRPFHALKIWHDVYERGLRYEVPEVPVFKRPKELPDRFMFVGRDWEDGDAMAYTGLRSVVSEMVKSEGDGCMGTRELKDGTTVMDVETGAMLEFDIEAAAFLLYEWFDDCMKMHDDPRLPSTVAFEYYARQGGLSVKAGMEAKIDEMLRRTHFKFRRGIAEDVDWKSLWEMSVSREEAGLAKNTNGKVRKRGAAGSRSIAYGEALDGSGQAPQVPLQDAPLPPVLAATQPEVLAPEPASQQLEAAGEPVTPAEAASTSECPAAAAAAAPQVPLLPTRLERFGNAWRFRPASLLRPVQPAAPAPAVPAVADPSAPPVRPRWERFR